MPQAASLSKLGLLVVKCSTPVTSSRATDDEVGMAGKLVQQMADDLDSWKTLARVVDLVAEEDCLGAHCALLRAGLLEPVGRAA